MPYPQQHYAQSIGTLHPQHNDKEHCPKTSTVDSRNKDTVGIREKYDISRLSVYPVLLSLFCNGWDIEIAS